MKNQQAQNLKKAFITGASSGIGLETAKLLSKNGYFVLGTTTNLPRGEKNWEGFVSPQKGKLLELNFSKAENYQNEIQKIFEENDFDLVINNAGMGEVASVEGTPMDWLRHMMEINFMAPVFICKLAAQKFRQNKAGLIINLGSIVSDIQFPFKAHYSASKAGLSAFTRSFARELKPLGIRVHVIEPGWVVSEFHQRLSPSQDEPSYYKRKMAPFLDHSQDNNPKSYQAKEVAQLILKVTLSMSFPIRIFAGPQAKKLFFLNNILPEKFKDFIIHHYLEKKSSS